VGLCHVALCLLVDPSSCGLILINYSAGHSRSLDGFILINYSAGNSGSLDTYSRLLCIEILMI